MPWSKVAGVQPFVVWQVAQVVGKPAATWFGFLVAWYFAWWQETQSVGVPVYFPPTWHCAHGTCWCAPVSGNRVLLWSKVAGLQPFVVWQLAQVMGKPAATWFGFLVAW